MHIPSDDARSEMLVILQEDISRTGLTRDDLLGDGARSGDWPAMAREQIAQFESMIRFVSDPENGNRDDPAELP